MSGTPETYAWRPGQVLRLAASLLLALASVIEKFDPSVLLDVVTGRTKLLGDRLYAMLYDSVALLPLYDSQTAELGARPRYGDHLLSERSISIVAGAERGRSIPMATSLMALRPVGFIREEDVDWICDTQLQERAFDEGGSCFAPWGRDLMWRIFNNKDGEGDVFLGTLDKSRCYVLVGDKDLRGSNGQAVILCFCCRNGVWCWFDEDIDRGHRWGAGNQLLTLSDSPV